MHILNHMTVWQTFKQVDNQKSINTLVWELTVASYPAFPRLDFYHTVNNKNLRHGKAGYGAKLAVLTPNYCRIFFVIKEGNFCGVH